MTALAAMASCLLAQLVSAHLDVISALVQALVTVPVLAPGPTLTTYFVNCRALKLATCLATPLHGPSTRALQLQRAMYKNYLIALLNTNWFKFTEKTDFNNINLDKLY